MIRLFIAAKDQKLLEVAYCKCLFLAPGAGHCYIEAGPIPTDALVELVAWVEHEIPPESLPAQLIGPGNAQVTRKICRYPLVSRYNGKGDPNSSSSYTCENSFHEGEHLSG